MLSCAIVSSFSILLLITCVTEDRHKFLMTEFFPATVALGSNSEFSKLIVTVI